MSSIVFFYSTISVILNPPLFKKMMVNLTFMPLINSTSRRRITLSYGMKHALVSCLSLSRIFHLRKITFKIKFD